MALSAKLWPFSSMSNNEKSDKKVMVSKNMSLNNTLFATSGADDEILEQLNSPDFELRLRTLNRLRNLALGHELWFKKFSKKLELFKSFANVLSDTNWEVQHQCIKFLSDTMRDYGQDLEWCMAIIMPNLIPKLGSSKITVRRVCLQSFIAYIKQVDGVHTFQKSLVQYGLQKTDKSLTKEILKEMPNLFISEFRMYNWSVLTEGLTEYLCSSAIDRESTDLILTVLEKMLQLVGQYQFNNYVHNLPANQKSRYEELLVQRGSQSSPYHQGNRNNSTRPKYDQPADDDEDEYSDSGARSGSGKQFRYGIIPVSMVDQLNNETDWQTRYDGLEKLKDLIESMSENDMKKLQPHLFSYINLLSNVLDDLNIKNIVLALDVLRASIIKMRRHVEPHLQHLVAAMAKHLGNQKAVVKQLNLSIIMELMRQLHPKPVFASLCGYLQHRNSRVREEVLNIVTIALLTHPSTDFNISAVSHVVSPLLADGKRRVRLAAFECFAVLANCVGVGKMESLMKHVREVEDTKNAPGLTHAVQSRLSRNQLPKIRYDGLLEYAALPVSPSGEEPRRFSDSANSGIQSADIEWIMSAGVGQGSAVSRSLSPIRYRATTAGEKHAVAQSGQQAQIRQQSPAPVRRVLSAGRNLRKLPWENGHQDHLVSIQQQNHQQQQQQQGDRVNNRSAPVRSNEGTPPLIDTQQRPNGRPGKLVDHLSSIDDPTKPNVPVPSNTKYSQQFSNGKVVLTPLDGNTRGNSDRRQSRIASPPEDDEVSNSFDHMKYTAPKRRDESQQQQSIKKSQSVNALVNVTANDYRNSWDDTPIKPATKHQMDTYFGGEIQSANATYPPPARSNHSESPRKNSLGGTDRIKGFTERRRSSDSVDSQQQVPIVAEVAPIRKPPLLAKRNVATKATVNKNRSSPPPRKNRSDSTVESSEASNRPYANPQQALTNALKKMSSDEWSDKIEGINSVERLARFNTNTLAADIQPVIIALNNESKNLRSSVSKQAMECYAHLFQYLKRSMDPEVERVCAVLMAKTGDTSNAFMREGATKALESMVDCVTPQRSLTSILATGANHKSATVRSACSQLMLRLVENMGASKTLANQPEFVEKVLLTATQFANDNQPQPRYYGKAVLALLSKDPDFGRMASRCLSDGQQRTVFNCVDAVRSKGLGGVSNGSSLASSMNGSIASGKSVPVNRRGSVRRKAKLPDDAMDTFVAAEKDLGSNNWEDRFQGVNRVVQLSENYSKSLSEDVKLLETYMARLNDINGKVAAQALQCLPPLLENLCPNMGETGRPVATEMVKCLSSQLPSKNEEIRRMAQDGLDCAVQFLDNSVLIQPLSIAVKTGNIKQKPELLKRLGSVSQNLFSTKPKLVQMHSMPVLYDLMKSQQADPVLRQATLDYARCLARMTGPRALIDSATPLSPEQKMELEEMLI